MVDGQKDIFLDEERERESEEVSLMSSWNIVF